MEKEIDTSNVNRIEVIDHTKSFEDGGGRAYTFWNQYDPKDPEKVKVTMDVQDGGKTLKVFIDKVK